MRKLVGLTAAVLLIGALAAPAVAQRVMLQPEVGVNFSNISNVEEEGVTTSSRTGFVAGVGVLFGLSERFSIGTGAYYSQQGVKVTDTDPTFGGEGTLKLDYIQVPLTLGIAFPTGGSVTPSIFAGPMIGFKASCKLTIDSSSANCDDQGVDITLKSTDFSALFGAGIAIAAGSGSFIINGWYSLGLTDIDDSSDTSSTESNKNSFFGFGVGYAFPLGGGG
jgi:hypothetical protein